MVRKGRTCDVAVWMPVIAGMIGSVRKAMCRATHDLCHLLTHFTLHAGRVPAHFCGCVGIKPTVGRTSTEGVVPACRSLDCVSVFARTVPDAAVVVRIMQARAQHPVHVAMCLYWQHACIARQGRAPWGLCRECARP